MRVIASLLVVAFAERVSNLMDTLSKLQELKDVATPDEQALFRQALASRAAPPPETAKLYAAVLERQKQKEQHQRKLFASCYSHDTKEKCDAQCPEDCYWDGDSCEERDCDMYDDETACCANAENVHGGCVWSHDQFWNRSECQDLRCSNLGKEAECTAHAGCKWDAGCGAGNEKCVDYEQTCEGDDSSCVCMGDLGDAMGQLMNLLSCPPVECVKCLAGDADNLESKCKDDCETVFHCTEEADCFIKAGGDDSSDSDDSKTCAPTYDHKGQCGTITKKLVDDDYEIKADVPPEDQPDSIQLDDDDTCSVACAEYDKHECNTCGGDITASGCAVDGASSLRAILPLAAAVLAAYVM